MTIILDKDDKFGDYTCSALDGKQSTEPIVTVITVMKEICKYILVNTILCIYHDNLMRLNNYSPHLCHA